MSMPVSGPGALSQRTDQQPLRDVTGLPYGDAGALRAQQAGAPMAQDPGIPQLPVTGLGAPSERPDQPITAGADAGAGPGSEVLDTASTGQPAGGAISSLLARAAASDPSGELARLLAVAQQKGL